MICEACDLGWPVEERDGVWWHESPTGNVGWICRTRSPEAVPARSAATTKSVTPEWLASMIRNYVEADDALKENGAVVVQTPGDPLTVLVFQKGGDHLMIQVNNAEVVIS